MTQLKSAPQGSDTPAGDARTPSFAQDTFVRCAPDVWPRFLDDEAVLLHLGSGTYFGANAVAAFALSKIHVGATVGEIAQAIEREFEALPEQIGADLDDMLRHLHEKQLITLGR